jgi:hypothetical protein
MYNPRRLRGAASGTTQGEAAGVAAFAAVIGAVGDKGNGGGIILATGTATGVIVRVAETDDCPTAQDAPATAPPHLDCSPQVAPGVQFDYTANGHNYRLTILNSTVRTPIGPDLQPMGFGRGREVTADGSELRLVADLPQPATQQE